MLLLVLAFAATRERRALLRGETPAETAAFAPAAEFDLSSPDSLWDGSDEDVELASAIDALWSSVNSSATAHAVNALGVNGSAPRQHPAVHIYGLFNTGTNLLFDLLAKNFNPIAMSPWKQNQPGWKHAKPSIYFQNYPHLKPQAGDVMLALIRDPMSWLQSMRKAPYNLQTCTVGTDWTTRPCIMTCDNWCMKAHAGPKNFASIEAVWNEYTSDYDTSTKYGYSKVVVVRYEDLVTQPGVELQRIGAALGIEPHGQVVHQYAPAKSHGMSNGRAQALEKLESKSYLGLYSNGDRPKACAKLDRPTMHRHDYHDCDSW